MPVDIAGLRKRGVDIPIPFFGETITVTYDPITAMNPDFKREWTRKQKEQLSEVGKWVEEWFEELKQQELPEDFPGRDHLIADGKLTYGQIPMRAADLKKLRGIGPATAQAIVNAVNNDLRIDENEIARRRELVFAKMTCMLVRDWDLTEGGEKLPIEPESFVGLPGLAQTIAAGVFEDIASLGNPKTSNGTRTG